MILTIFWKSTLGFDFLNLLFHLESIAFKTQIQKYRNLLSKCKELGLFYKQIRVKVIEELSELHKTMTSYFNKIITHIDVEKQSAKGKF